MTLFSHYIALDWSAANSPKRGKDSIWLCDASGEGAGAALNLPTRFAAMNHLRARIEKAIITGQSILIGCDFAFGYPAGTIDRVANRANWAGVWDYIHGEIIDGPDNRSNRFAAAAQMNLAMGLNAGPFWGHPHQHRYDGLGPKSPVEMPPDFPRRRIVEQRASGAKSVWQLAYNGAVGSQTLLGIAALEGLRRDPELGPHIAVWPFETKLSGDLSKPIIFAEIYPSSHDVDKGAHDILDAAQVMCVARDLAYWDKTGALSDKLSAFGLTDVQRELVIGSEGWILGQ